MSEQRVAVILDDATFGAPVELGTLRREKGSGAEVLRFSYAEAWLRRRTAFPLDPELPLHPGDFFSRLQSGMFGALRDTSPDRWGRVLMERREGVEARGQRRRPRRLSEWDFLLGVSDVTRIGALRLLDSESGVFLDGRALGAPPSTQLRKLQAIAKSLDRPGSEDHSEYEAWLRQLVVPGSSLGGARPKATFAESDGSLWIAKFPGQQDRFDVGSWEMLAHELAIRAKINAPDAKLLKLARTHHTFAVRRFDRHQGGRRLYVSAMSLLVREDGAPGSYLDIAQAIQDHGDPGSIMGDLTELYRRAIFNVLVGNRDDHLRNHGFLRGPKGWRLSPAFDINPNPDKDEHAISLDGTIHSPSVEAIRATHELYRLKPAAAARIEKAVRAAFDGWELLARDVGIRRAEVERLSAVINASSE